MHFNQPIKIKISFQNQLIFREKVMWQDRRVTGPASRKTQLFSHLFFDTTLISLELCKTGTTCFRLSFQRSLVSLKFNPLHSVQEVIKFSEVCFVYLDLCTDIKIFTRHSDFHTNVQSFFQEGFYQNSAQFSKIRKYKKTDDLLIFQLFKSFLVMRLWSFSFLANIDFTGDLGLINRNKCLYC